MSERRLAAIMFTDIVGYTALMGSDEERAFEVLRKNKEIHSKLIKQYNGTLIKEIGDGMLVSFNLASDAVRCAIDIQKACKDQNIPLKIGIHEGEMVFEGTDVLGDGVNIASRLQESAEDGCVVISGSVYKDIKNKTDIRTHFIKEKSFKNVDEPVRVYKVSCEKHPVEESIPGNWKNHPNNLTLPFIKTRNAIIILLVLVVVILVYPKIFRKNKFEEIKDPDGRISIAVMPFNNLSGDSLYNVWQGGLQNLLITSLSNSEELSVRQYQTMYHILQSKRNLTTASITPSVARELALKLETRTFILGNILKAGNTIRVNAQLVNAETEEIYKTYQLDWDTEDDIFVMADSLSGLIKNYLEIKKLIEQYDSPAIRGTFYTNSSEAFEYYIHGWDAIMNLDYQASIEWLSKAIETDSGFITAYVPLLFSYRLSGNDKLAKNLCNIANNKMDELPLKGKLVFHYLHAYIFETPNEQIKYLKQILEIDELNPSYWKLLGLAYYKMHQYKDASIYFEKALEINKKWGTNYHNPYIYNWLGIAYHKINEHKKEKEVYELGLSIFPDLTRIIQRQAICALSQGDTKEADGFIMKYKSIKKNKDLWPESSILSSVGYIYEEANLFNEAEVYFRQALKLDPRNSLSMNNLAWLLVNNDINVKEGTELVQKALDIEPDNCYFLDTKGWGLYKQGRYEESLKALTDAWDKRDSYRHEFYLHIKEVENALAKK